MLCSCISKHFAQDIHMQEMSMVHGFNMKRNLSRSFPHTIRYYYVVKCIAAVELCERQGTTASWIIMFV